MTAAAPDAAAPAPRIVQVAVPRPLRRAFDYAVPEPLPMPPPGARVRVPFGAGRPLVGVVVGHARESARELAAVADVLDDAPLLDAHLLALADWLARYYHHPIGAVIAAMLPARAAAGAPAQLRETFAWRALDGGEQALGRAPRQRDAWQRLRAAGPVAEAELGARGIARAPLRALAAKGLAQREAAPPRYALPETWPIAPNAAQQAAIDAVAASFGSAATHLLYGVTGSGKTEVYLRAIAEALRRGRQALVLVPEIALAPQTTALFRQRFGAAAALHSSLADAERYDIYLKCARGIHKVLIGTRSAVFAPFRDLGIIVVDEEHDGSFKQGDGLRYSARDVAVKRGRMLAAPVLLGSATPALETLENARRGRYRPHRLPQRAGGASMPALRTVDLRGERLQGGFSGQVLAAIGGHLRAGGQVLAFVNRRGYAPTLFCASCAWRAQCAHCDAKLTFHRLPGHGAPGVLRCHHCGRSQRPPAACPSCGSAKLLPVGSGTQRIEETLAERFPDVPLYRIDRDTTRSMNRLRAHLAAIREGAPCLIVGTQMLAKGHHLPGVTLVVVLDADAGFLSADFRAPERTAQLIIQVAGRAGRAERPGEVWIQTYDPANANLAALIASGYGGFAASERRARRDAGMPPFAALAVLRAQSVEESRASALLSAAADALRGDGVDVLGPAPAPVSRIADRHRCQLLALAARRADLHRALRRAEDAQLDAAGVRWSIDVDPLDVF